jgi:hypothetical protein
MPLWSSGQSFWLQIQRSRFRFPALPDFLRSRVWNRVEVHSASWGQLRSYLNEKVPAPVQKTEINGSGNSLHWPRNTLYPQRSALTLPTSDGRSVSIVRLRTKATGFSFLMQCQLKSKPKLRSSGCWGPRRFLFLSGLWGTLPDERGVLPVVGCHNQIYMVTILTILHVYVTHALSLVNNLSIHLFAILHSWINMIKSTFDVHLHYLQQIQGKFFHFIPSLHYSGSLVTWTVASLGDVNNSKGSIS